MMSQSRTRRVAELLILSATVFAAACLGGRAGSPAGTPTVAAKAADTARRDTAVSKLADTAVKNAAARAAVPMTAAEATAIAAAAARNTAAADSALNAAKKTPAKKPAKKPAKECLLNMNDSPPESRFSGQRQSDSSNILFIGGGFVGRCEGEKNVIKADSAEYWQQTGFITLIGNVTYEETKEFRVTANHAIYFTREGKLYADGTVIATQLKSGSTFSGPKIEYFRVMPDLRTVSYLRAPNSPIVRIAQKDSTGKTLEPITISSSEMVDTGDSLLFAWGSVNMRRTDIIGRSDSASFDKPTGKARLIRAANIASTAKDQSFTLAGDTIDLFTKDQVLTRVLAIHVARARSGDVNMSAERLDMQMVDRKIERAYAFGPGRAKADMPQQNLEADSIDIHLPNQRIQELRAFGRASAIGKPDSLKIKSDERDELRGDTVIAVFDTARAPGDTSSKPVLLTVTAGGRASSKFQVASRQGPTSPPAINYVRGKHLVVSFDSGQVRSVAVDSSASGYFIEPVTDSLTDSTKKKPPVRKPPAKLSVIRDVPVAAPLRKLPYQPRGDRKHSGAPALLAPGTESALRRAT